tara:strand:- start:1682 stop:2125 length:444 start_codon:yes stop_codon:yes gene_type:complete
MTWTYSGDPANNDRDKVRFLVFDTDTNEQLLSDEEIAWLLSEQTNVYLAAANAAEVIAAKFAKDISRSVVGISATPGGRAEFYLELAEKLRNQIGTTNKRAEVFAGGLTISGKESLDGDTDAVQPGFKIGDFDWNGPYDSADETGPQ